MLFLASCGEGTAPEKSGPPSKLTEFFYSNDDNMGLKWKNGDRARTEIFLAIDGVRFELHSTAAVGVDSVAFGRWCSAFASAAWGIRYVSFPADTVFLRGSSSARAHVPLPARLQDAITRRSREVAMKLHYEAAG